MDQNGIVEKVRRGWRAVLIGAVLGGLLFGAYAMLSRSAGSFSQRITFQLADPEATVAATGLDRPLTSDDTAVGVADLLQSTATDRYGLENVRVTARGIDGSRTVIVTITGPEDDVQAAAAVIEVEFPNDRAAEQDAAIQRAIESVTSARESFIAEVTQLDDEIATLSEADGVLRERLLLDRLETTRQVLASEQQIADLERLLNQDPAEGTRLLLAASGESVGASPISAVVLGLLFGALVGLVVVLTRPSAATGATA